MVVTRRVVAQGPLHQNRHPSLRRAMLVRPSLARCARLGPGFLAIELARLGSYRITGLDISKSFVRIATENAIKAGVEVTFREGNASSMPFESDSFDFVYCRAAFKNFSEPVQAGSTRCIGC